MTAARENPRWMLDEARATGRENVDPAHVERYDAREDADGERPLR
jgi:hypothetical protein